MSKLADFLKELKESKFDKRPKLKGRDQKKSISRLTFILLISLFIAFFFVGYYLPMLILKKIGLIQERQAPQERLIESPKLGPPQAAKQYRNVTEKSPNMTWQADLENKVTSLNNQSQEVGKKRERTKVEISKEFSPKPLKQQKLVAKRTIEGSEQVGKMKEQTASSRKNAKKVATHNIAKKIPKPRESEPFHTISPSGDPPLRQRELAYNLLLNAEEERKRGNYEEAIRLYNEYLKHTEDPNVLNNLGALYILKGNYKKAEICFERAFQLKRDPLYEVNYFIALLKQGRVEEVCKKIRYRDYPHYLSEQVEAIRSICR